MKNTNVGVITSYSIHYTKLYDLGQPIGGQAVTLLCRLAVVEERGLGILRLLDATTLASLTGQVDDSLS